MRWYPTRYRTCGGNKALHRKRLRLSYASINHWCLVISDNMLLQARTRPRSGPAGHGWHRQLPTVSFGEMLYAIQESHRLKLYQCYPRRIVWVLPRLGDALWKIFIWNPTVRHQNPGWAPKTYATGSRFVDVTATGQQLIGLRWCFQMRQRSGSFQCIIPMCAALQDSDSTTGTHAVRWNIQHQLWYGPLLLRQEEVDCG